MYIQENQGLQIIKYENTHTVLVHTTIIFVCQVRFEEFERSPFKS